MNSAQKVSLSLLIAVISFSAFALIAFSGFFDYFEATFYNRRVTESVTTNLRAAGDAIADELGDARLRFERVVREPAVQTVFQTNRSQADIQETENFLGRLREEIPSLLFVRVIGPNQLHYSSLQTDILAESELQRRYLPLADIAATPPVATLLLPESREFGITLSPENNIIVVQVAIETDAGIRRGTGLFYLSPSDLSRRLVRDGYVDPNREVAVVAAEGLLVNARSGQEADLRTRVRADWDTLRAAETGAGVESGAGTRFLVFFHEIPDVGVAAYLAPATLFELDPIMRIILLGGIFLTTFLVVFLALNVRQDPVVVLSERVKKFQINLLREYLENRGEMNWNRWQRELERRKDDVNRDIKKGVGKLRGRKAEKVDELLDKSWDEIFQVLGEKGAEEPKQTADIARLEQMVERVVRNLSAMNTGRGSATRAAGSVSKTAPSRGTPIEVEELEELDTEEAEASAMPRGRPVEVEDVDEADEVEDLAEMEEVSEMEELDELESDEVQSTEDQAPRSHRLGIPVEVEEVEELEDLAEVEEISEAEEVGEVETAGASDRSESSLLTESPAGRGTPVEVEDIDDEEGLEELEELAELDEVEAVDAAEEDRAWSPGAPQRPELEESAELEDLGEAEEPEELEDLAEAEESAEMEDLGEAEEPEELEDLGEAEEPEELEDLGEVEESAELEDLGEAEEPAELEDLGEAEEPEELEDLGEAEEPEELEDLGEVEESAELEDLGEAEEPAGREPANAEQVPEKAETRAPTSGQDVSARLEELRQRPVLGEIVLDAGDIELAAEEKDSHEGGEAEETAGDRRVIEEIDLLEDLDDVEGSAEEGSAEGDEAASEPLSVGPSEAAPEAATDTPDRRPDRAPRRSRLLGVLENPLDLADLEEAEAASTGGPQGAATFAAERPDGANGDLEDSVGPAEAEEAPEPEDLEEVAALDEVPEPEDLEEVAALEEAPEPEDLEEVAELEPELESLEVEEAVAEPADEAEDAVPVSALETLAGAPSSFLTSRFYFNHDWSVYRDASPPRPAAEAPPREMEPVWESEPAAAVEKSIGPITDFETCEVSELAVARRERAVIESTRDGVFQISGRVYEERPSRVDASTAELVDSVVRGREAADLPESAEKRSGSEGETAGIDTLFGGSDLNFFDEPAEPVAPIRKSVFDTAQPEVIERFPIGEAGIDWDSLLTHFRRSEGGVYRSVVAATKAWDAKVGVIFVEEKERFRPAYAIGLDEECRSKLEIRKNSELYRQVFKQKRVLFIRQPLDEVAYFTRACSGAQLGFLRRSLLLPIVFRGQDAYLLVGVAESVETLEEALLPIASGA